MQPARLLGALFAEVRPVDEVPLVPLVDPDLLQAAHVVEDAAQHQLRPVALLDVGRMDHDRQEQSQRIDENVAFAAVDLLPRVVAARPPLSVVFTD